MNKKWLIANIVLFLAFIILFSYLIKLEVNDNKVINKYYKDITDKTKNKECLQYLQTINAYPYWRLTWYASFILTSLTSFYLFSLLTIKNISKWTLFWLFFWFSLLINNFLIYKFLTLWNWHYVSNNGGAKDNIFTQDPELPGPNK